MQSNVSNKATNLYTDSNYQLYSVVYLYGAALAG